MLSLSLLLALNPLLAQGNKARQAQKKQERTERAEDRAYEKARKKDIRNHFDSQTKETQKRMKEAERRARKFNNQGEEGFIKRLFGKKGCDCP